MIDNIGVLMHKTIVIPVEPLLTVCDMAATCSAQLPTHIQSLAIRVISNRQTADELCLSRLALKWPNLTLIQLVPEELNAFCIHALRFGVGGDGVPSERQILCSMSSFWLIPLAVSRDVNAFGFVPASLVRVGIPSLAAQFNTILSLLAIFRTSCAFLHVGGLITVFVNRVLAFVIARR